MKLTVFCGCGCHEDTAPFDCACEACDSEDPCPIVFAQTQNMANAGNALAQSLFSDAQHRVAEMIAGGMSPTDALHIVLTGLCGAMVMSLTHIGRSNKDPQVVAHNLIDILWGIKPTETMRAEAN